MNFDYLSKSIEEMKIAVEELKKNKPPSCEVWIIKNFPEENEDGEPFIIKCNPDGLDWIESFTDADIVFLMSRNVWDLIQKRSIENHPVHLTYVPPFDAIPVFDEDTTAKQIADVSMKNFMIRPMRPIEYWNGD